MASSSSTKTRSKTAKSSSRRRRKTTSGSKTAVATPSVSPSTPSTTSPPAVNSPSASSQTTPTQPDSSQTQQQQQQQQQQDPNKPQDGDDKQKDKKPKTHYKTIIFFLVLMIIGIVVIFTLSGTGITLQRGNTTKAAIEPDEEKKNRDVNWNLTIVGFVAFVIVAGTSVHRLQSKQFATKEEIATKIQDKEFEKANKGVEEGGETVEEKQVEVDPGKIKRGASCNIL